MLYLKRFQLPLIRDFLRAFLIAAANVQSPAASFIARVDSVWPVVYIKTAKYFALTVPFLSEEWRGPQDDSGLRSPAVTASLAFLNTLRAFLDECAPEFDDVSLRKLQRKLVVLLPFGQPDLQRLDALNAISELQPSETIAEAFPNAKVVNVPYYHFIWLKYTSVPPFCPFRTADGRLSPFPLKRPSTLCSTIKPP